MQGTLKWFDERKGYGFIKPDNGSKDIFLHATALEEANIDVVLEPEDRIEFDVGTSKKTNKECAINVKLLTKV